jgi:hypothetical protein
MHLQEQDNCKEPGDELLSQDEAKESTFEMHCDEVSVCQMR